MISVYTDGSCLGNPGNGGWAFLIVRERNISFRAGFEENSTNNRMELMAAIKALEFLDNYNESYETFVTTNFIAVNKII